MLCNENILVFNKLVMNFDNLKRTDTLCYELVQKEIERQETSIELIPSECIASLSTIEALWSPFTNKYSEWYYKKRYYAWCDVVDEVEKLAIDRAKQAYKVAHVNVQPYSWSPANLAVYNAVCNVGDTVMGLKLTEGWHLTHGWKASATSKFFNTIQYWLKEDWYINLEEVEKMALEHKPKLIWIWATAYSREFPFKEFSVIAEKVWAYLAADIAHISGLVIAWVHTSPVPYVDIVTTTTHKTLRWPRWGMIMVTDKWLKKDSDLAKKIDQSVFPWLQWWPHNHQTLAIAVALWEALKPEFIESNKQIIKNAKVLAEELMNHWIDVVSWWTDTHLVLAKVWVWKGIFMHEACEIAWISLNKNTIPRDPASPFYPSGIRMWTPILTMRWMKEGEIKKVASFVCRVYDLVKHFEFSEDKEKRLEILRDFRKFVKENEELKKIREEVRELCLKFPIYK